MRTFATFAVVLVAACHHAPSPVVATDAPPAGDPHRLARDVFERHCAVCHGTEGRGDGPASAFLFPPARDFGSGRFRLVSGELGGPRERDLVQTLRRGMPGSAMPAWDWLGDETLERLAVYVRQLAVRGYAEDMVTLASDEGEELALTDALALARERLSPGRPLPVPTDDSLVDLALGHRLFQQNCAACHGTDGTGTTEPRFNEDGELNWARDLTAGYVKGGTSTEAIAARIGAGLPGSAMPPTTLEEAELASLVAHVRSLIPERTEERLVHRTDWLRARRTDELPTGPDHPGWGASEEIAVVLSPLWWGDEPVVYATLGAVHDGERIAVRVRWPDVTGETALFTDVHRPDGVALQFSEAPLPPLFGMGSSDHPTSVWHWKSVRLEEVAGALELVSPTPHATSHLDLDGLSLDAPVYRGVDGSPEVSESVQRLTARGVDAVPDARRERSDVEVSARWSDGEWSAVFVRSLTPSAANDVELVPGRTLQIACAVWNGAAGDTGAKKSISIWQTLELAR